MDAQDLEKLNDMLDNESDLREVNTVLWLSSSVKIDEAMLLQKIRDKINDLDKKTRTMVGILNKIHSTRTESSNARHNHPLEFFSNGSAVPALLDSVRPILISCGETFEGLAELIPAYQFWRWKDMWCHSLRTAIFAATIIEYLTNHSLLSLKAAAETLGSRSPSHRYRVHIKCI